MLEKLFEILKKGILSFFVLYSYNILAQSFNMIIPINLITVITITIFDIPGLVALIILCLII